jgi:hypothetical protein
MEHSRRQAQAVGLDLDTSDAVAIRSEETFRRNPDAEAAIQYLTWALEMIEKVGSGKAASHTRAAIAALQKGSSKPDRG